MTASVEAQAERCSTTGDHIGIITEDATVLSIADYRSTPMELGNEKLSSRKDSMDTATGASNPKQMPITPPSNLDYESSPGIADNLHDIALKSGRRCYFRIPGYVWTALAVLVVFEALAITGSILYARSVNHDARRAAADVARAAARAIETVLDHLIAPVMSLANLVHLQPHWPTVNASFPVFSDAVYKTNKYFQIELCPYGVVGAMAMPWMNATGNITGEEWSRILKYFDYELDILDPKRPAFDDEVKSILQNGSVMLLGPWYADGELSTGAFVVRYSIFLPPGNWDMPPNSIDACPQEVCNTASGLTWWGWSNAVFAWKTVAPSLKAIHDRNLLYTLAPDPGAVNQSFLAMSDKLPNPTECEVVRVDVYGWLHWTFCVESPGGFGPSWFKGLCVGVTALSVLLASLVGLVLRSRYQAVKYLARQMETNRQLAVAKEEAEEGRRNLEAEKLVMDALLQRQRNLIELFGKEDELLTAVGDGDEALLAKRLMAVPGTSSSMLSNLSRESATVDRIEAVRRQLAGPRSIKQSTAAGQEVKLLEMLGEGSFGKVYRGVWRGTDVAVKTMVLPANMSGAEKREKMAIMEAAISSSLAHPNIVQTYTYFIRTVREEAQSDSDSNITDGILVGGAPDGSSLSAVGGAVGSSLGKTFDEPSQRNTPPAVHGYEVRLVLEYCDRGCLRDALDGDAFLTSCGVNYSGVLDTAADIAKAMLHLHLADVLHGDLKARNVMLKSSGTEGRGVVGKVADFGLAVKMDTLEQTHMSGMYQGTLTHMAPELLLHGRMSKAVDVYAFGVTLWELFTGGQPFQGVPRALLGHQIAEAQRRPAFPPFAPELYVQLAEECWAHRPDDRPSFEVILDRLLAMRSNLPGLASPLAAYSIGASPPLAQLPKLDGNAGPSNVAPSPAYNLDASSGIMSGALVLGGSSLGGSGLGGSIGSGINWAFAKSSHRTPLAVVKEDERELDVSSKPLPAITATAARPNSRYHVINHQNASSPDENQDQDQEGPPTPVGEADDVAVGPTTRSSPSSPPFHVISLSPPESAARDPAMLPPGGSGSG